MPLATLRSGRIVAEDDFIINNGGWEQLFTPNSAAPTAWGTVSRRAGRGQPRMVVRTPNVASASGMMLKRMPMTSGPGRFLGEFILSIENVTALTDRPQYFDFGFDTSSPAGIRQYFKFRFLNYNQGGSAQVQKFQVSMGNTASPVYTDLPNGAYPWMTVTNENKGMQMYCAMQFNTVTGLYEGFKFNSDITSGELAPTSNDGFLKGLGPIANETLTTFRNGINACVEVVNRTDAAQTAACFALHYHRLTQLAL